MDDNTSRYAHSIKNKHIIHKLNSNRYLCISSTTTPTKSTTNWKDVTCKNCLRQWQKRKKTK